jgi:Flp pilus assembly protein TadD
MKFLSRWMEVLCLTLFALIPAHAQSYDSELKLGVEAYQRNRCEYAIRHLRKATELDPRQPAAHM